MSKMLVAFDVETTGLDRKADYIIQFSAVKYDTELCKVVDEYNTYIKPSGPCSISIGALDKHHITPQFLEDKPIFAEVAQEIYGFIDGCDLLGYNCIGFDCPFLKKEFHDVGIEWNFSDLTIYDSFLEEKRRHANTLEATFARYMKMTMEEAGYDAHNSLSDVKATLNVYRMQQEDKAFGPENVLSDDGFVKVGNFNGKEHNCFAVGKYAGVAIAWVAKNDKKYMSWVVNNNDFDKKTRALCESYMGLEK